MNFAKKTITAIGGKILGAAFSLLTSILLARFLGVEGVGQYQLLVSTKVVLITFMAMGFGNASIYFINSEKISQEIIVVNLLKFFSIISVLLAISFFCILILFEDYFGNLTYLSRFIFVIGTSSLLLFNILLPVLYAKLEVVKLQILSLITPVFLVIGILFLYIINLFDIDHAIFLVGVTNSVALSTLLYFLKSSICLKVKMDLNLLKRLFSFGLRISAANLVFILSSNLVIFLLKSLSQDGFIAVGLLSRATAIANMFLLIPSAIGPLIYSKWSLSKIDKINLEVEKVLRLFILFTVGCTIFTILFGEFLIRFLYGPEFMGASNSLILLSSSIIFSSITVVLNNLFSSRGKPSITLKVYILSLLLTTLFAYVLIPLYNIEGASTAILIGTIVNAIGLFYFSNKEIGLSLVNSLSINKSDINFLLKNLNFIK